MAVHGIIGKLYLNPAGAAGKVGACLLPMLEGTRRIQGPALRRIFAAQGQLEPTMFSQGPILPAILVRTYVLASWATVNNIKRMLGVGQVAVADDTRVAATNQLAGDIGAVQWKFAGKSAVQYTKAKVGALSFAWGRVGEVLIAELAILPFGAEEAATTASLPAAQWGSPYMSQGAFYGASPTFSDVEGGQISFNTQLSPKLTTPAPVPPSGSNYGKIYAEEYDNYDLMASLMLRQRTDAATQQEGTFSGSQSSPLPWVLSGLKVGFKDPIGANPFVFTMSGLSPDNSQTVSAGIGEEERVYTSHPASAAATPDATALSVQVGAS